MSSTSLNGPYERDSYGGLVAVGYITAVLIPLVGFILGIVVATRPARAARHGWRIITLSVVVFFVGLVIVLSAIRHSENAAVQQFNQQMQQIQQQATQAECQADPSLSICQP